MLGGGSSQAIPQSSPLRMVERSAYFWLPPHDLRQRQPEPERRRKNLASVKTGKPFTTPRRVKIVNRGPSIHVYLDDDPKPVINVESTHCGKAASFSAPTSHSRFGNVKITARK